MHPRMHLANLTLHSPSSIVGTPFDLSPRFEYPFPAGAVSEPDFSLAAASYPAFPSALAAFSLLSSTSMPALPPTTARPAPTHPKLRSCQPPVPPGLAKKRRPAPPADVPVRPRSSSLSTVYPVPDPDVALRLAQSIQATLQRRLSDDTVVDDEDKDKEQEQGGEQGVDDAPKVDEHPDVTFLGRTLRATSDASLTDVDPAEDMLARELDVSDAGPSRPRSPNRAESPAPCMP